MAAIEANDNVDAVALTQPKCCKNHGRAWNKEGKRSMAWLNVSLCANTRLSRTLVTQIGELGLQRRLSLEKARLELSLPLLGYSSLLMQDCPSLQS